MENSVEIGITAWRTPGAWDAASICHQAETAEALGFHSYWLPENHFGDARAIPSPLTLLAAAAVRTQSLRLATTSYLLPIRHPLQAAEEVAVVDQLSGGRLILGLGRGIQDSVFTAFGINSKQKRSRFSTHLETMRQAWRGEPICEDKSGEAVTLAPLPVQRPHPPLWVAAFGPLALQQVGGLGLPYLSSPLEPLETLVDNYAMHRTAAREAGRDLEPTVPVMRTVFISEQRSVVSHMKSKLKSVLPPPLQREDVGVDDWAIIGDRHYARDRIAEYVDRLAVTHFIGGGRLPFAEEPLLHQSHAWLAEMGGLL